MLRKWIAVSVAKDSSAMKRDLWQCLRDKNLQLQECYIQHTRFCPTLKVTSYFGYQETRAALRQELQDSTSSESGSHSVALFDVLITSYEIAIKDHGFLKSYNWNVLVVDEAHRLKNAASVLHQQLKELNTKFSLLLTGTPIQNKLEEIFSLLCFICPEIFQEDAQKEFCQFFAITGQGELQERDKLHNLLKPFLLRRTKAEVLADLPKKSEVVMYTGMSKTQKELYRGILLRDIDALVGNTGSGSKTRLMNILMQLRKCCNHPYIFTGVEPEPFEIGEHIVTASGKLFVIDQLLSHLKQSSHKVLLFCQMTTMLDIIQDYLTYRGYTYERLDGSVRGEERYLAVSNFNASDDTFIFLLSTKAGGVGLNLTSADTIIFVDSDFNPQNDLQAAARAHRIGQNRPVKIIRLLTRSSVDEIVYNRAEAKLRLTNAIVEGGQFSNVEQVNTSNVELARILKFGLDDLMNADQNTLELIDLESILGPSKGGMWLDESIEPQPAKEEVSAEETNDDMYVFDGFSYKNVKKDDNAAEQLKNFAVEDDDEEHGTSGRGRNAKAPPIFQLQFAPRKRKILTEEEKEERKKKREESARAREEQHEVTKAKKAEQQQKRLEKLWEDNDYVSLKIVNPSSDNEDDDDVLVNDEDDNSNQLNYVVGDVTSPQHHSNEDAIIVHCVDTSGSWGSGGLFSALSRRSKAPANYYELAGEMSDLAVGQAHLVELEESASSSGKDYVALVVAQKRDRNNVLSSVLLTHLASGLERIYRIAKEKRASVHLPRIGHNTPKFNWYAIERSLKKILSSRGVKTYIYYYQRKGKEKTLTRSDSVDAQQAQGFGWRPENLHDVFTNMKFYLHGISENDSREIQRCIIAYNGDVVTIPDVSVTHVVTASEHDQADLPAVCRSAFQITRKWIGKCIRSGSILQINNNAHVA